MDDPEEPVRPEDVLTPAARRRTGPAGGPGGPPGRAPRRRGL